MSPEEVRQALARYLESHGPRLSPRGRASARHRTSHWIKTLPSRLEFSTEALEAYRNAALAKGYKHQTIEAAVDNVRRIAEANGVKLAPGRRLRKPRPSPDVPSLERIDKLYRSVGVAEWPPQLSPDNRVRWWQGYLALASWTGLRIGDLTELSWASVAEGVIVVEPAKTKSYGTALRIPIVPHVERHLDQLREVSHRGHTGTVLGLTRTYRQMRRELKRIAKHAGVGYVCPHGFRRFAVSNWGRVDSQAGAVLHGSGLGVLAHYVSPAEILAHAAGKVVVPQSMQSESERGTESEEEQLLARFRSASEVDRQWLLSVVERF